MNFEFPEVQLLAPAINARRELTFRVRVKAEDYTIEDFAHLAESVDHHTFALAIVPIDREVEEDPLPKLRQSLALVMKEYCEAEGRSEEEETQRLYEKYKVASRMMLSAEELKTAIEEYRAGIEYHNMR
jgi:hypothetical protein